MAEYRTDERDRGVVWATGCPEGFGSDPHLRRSPSGELGPARVRVKKLWSGPVDPQTLQPPEAVQQIPTPYHSHVSSLAPYTHRSKLAI